MTNNTINDTAEIGDVDYYLFITQIICYCVISFVGTLANVVICVGLSRGRLKSSEYFILNLAIADLLVCAIGIPLDIYENYSESWPYGAFLCHVIYPSQTLLILISILTLMGMSLERHRAICSPLKQRLRPKFICGSIGLIWLIAVAIVVPYAKILKYSEGYCDEDWERPDSGKYYTLVLFIIDYCIPLTIISYCYVRAGYVLHTKFKKFNAKQSTSTKQNLATMKRLQQNRKVIKIFSSAVVLFVICVLPGDCYWMWASFRTIESHPYDNHFQTFSTITLYANSAINPFIFGAFQMICHRKMQSQIREQLTSTTGFSRSKGSGSSEPGEGLKRFTFSRTALRKNAKYSSLDTKNEKDHDAKKHLDNTMESEHSTKLIYRDTNRHFHDTNANLVDTSQDFRKAEQEQCDKDSKPCDTNEEFRYANEEMCETKHALCDANDEERDTDEGIRDTKQVVRRKSDEIFDDEKSISSDSCATLHRESDTFSMTSETIQNTNCGHEKQNENTNSQWDNTIERNATHGLKQNAQENSEFAENESNESTENGAVNTENEHQNTKTEHANCPTLDECEKTTQFSGSTEFGINKINENFSNFLHTKSMRETDL